MNYAQSKMLRLLEYLYNEKQDIQDALLHSECAEYSGLIDFINRELSELNLELFKRRYFAFKSELVADEKGSEE